MDLPYHKTQQIYYIRKKRGKCVRCGSEKENPDMVHCNSCKEKVRVQRKTKYISNKSNKLCVNCNSTLNLYNTYCDACATKNKKRSRVAAKNTKIKVINHYGEKCFCCEESILDFLTIDHIDENGSAHRKSIGGKSTNYCGEKFYAWLIRKGLPPGYQTACFNCNIGKHRNGICPHQKRKRTA